MSPHPHSVKRAGFLALIVSIHVNVDDAIRGDVIPPQDPPKVTITAPAEGSAFATGTSVNFTATADDPQDGDLSPWINWWSSIDGDLGTGDSVIPAWLSPGIHKVTASATDSDSHTGTDSIEVSIVPDCETELYSATFETDDGGFVDGASTCVTGRFIRDTPDEVIAGGVTTQPRGAASGRYAWFTQTNSGGPGIDDVDGGTCETLSPPVVVNGEPIVLFLEYFHGQRDENDDPADGFVIELIDADSGGVLDTLVSGGDVTTHAVWTPTFAVIDSTPTRVQLRVRVTDGPAAGDLIEAGLDDVLMCAIPSIPPPGQPPVG